MFLLIFYLIVVSEQSRHFSQPLAERVHRFFQAMSKPDRTSSAGPKRPLPTAASDRRIEPIPVSIRLFSLTVSGSSSVSVAVPSSDGRYIDTSDCLFSPVATTGERTAPRSGWIGGDDLHTGIDVPSSDDALFRGGRPERAPGCVRNLGP